MAVEQIGTLPDGTPATVGQANVPANTGGVGAGSNPPGGATPASLGLTAPDNSALKSAQNAASGGYYDSNGNPTTAPDFNTVYNNTITGFQGEIDSLNKAAAQARAQITSDFAPVAANRVGGNIAVQGRRGLLGSDFGLAQTDTVNQANTTELNGKIAASDADYNNRISSLYSQARTMADQQYNAKTTAYQGGAKSAVDWLTTGKAALQTQQATDLAKQALAIGHALSDPQYSGDVSTLAQQIGVTPQYLIQIYNSTKKAQDDAAAKAAKDAQTSVPQGSEIVQTQPDGTTKTVATGQPKTINAGRYGTLQFNPTTNQYEPITKPVLPAQSGPALTVTTYEVDGAGKTWKVTTKNGKVTTRAEQKTTDTVPGGTVNVAGANLEAQKGGDGKISPEVWNAGLQQWVAKGYSAKSYNTNFGKFVNPADSQDYNYFSK